MTENSNQTKPHIVDNIVSTESITLSLPIMVKTVPTPDWLNTKTDTSDTTISDKYMHINLDSISPPILRRHSPPLKELSYDYKINNNQSLIDIMDEHDKIVTNTSSEQQYTRISNLHKK